MNRLEDYLQKNGDPDEILKSAPTGTADAAYLLLKAVDVKLETIPDEMLPDDYEIDLMIKSIERAASNPIIESAFQIGNTLEKPIVEFPDYLLNDPEVVGYPDKDFQIEMYNWVFEKIKDKEFSIKDYGAGRGDFFNHLNWNVIYDETEPTQEFDYIGIELNPNLCAVGRHKYPDIDLINDNYLNVNIKTDYTICIGTLNEDHGYDKWEYFNLTLNRALETTNKAIFFVLSSNVDGFDGFLDYPMGETIGNLPANTRFTIDYTRFEDIYLLTVHIGGWN